MDSDSHSNNKSVFLIDDESGDWFEKAKAQMKGFASKVHGLNETDLEGEKDGELIFKIFIDRIKILLNNSSSKLFFVITDSSFGITPEIEDAGSRLLHYCNSDEQLKDKFGSGVVYSGFPRGNIIKNKIERLSHNSKFDNIEVDILNILDFFKTGEFMPIQSLLDMIKALGFLKITPSLPVNVGEQDTIDIFRPVTCYGCPIGDPQNNQYLSDSVFVCSKNLPVIPFSLESRGFFKEEVYKRFVNVFDVDPDNRKNREGPQAYIVSELLCPYTSMMLAAESLEFGYKQAYPNKGAFRFLWDIVMSGNDVECFKRDQRLRLKNCYHSPQSFDDLFDEYCRTFDRFQQEEDKLGAFLNLWYAAGEEYKCISDAVYIALKRGLQ